MLLHSLKINKKKMKHKGYFSY